MSAEETTTPANDNTGGADGGSEVKAAEASPTEGAQETVQPQGSDSLLAESQEGAAQENLDGKEPEPGSEGEGKDGGEDGKDNEPEEITPESYGDFEIPENMPVNQPMLDSFKELAAANKLSKEAAQALVSLKVQEVQNQMAAFQEQRKAWVGELKADPDFGGQAFESNVKTAQMTLRQFDVDGGALKALQGVGLDNHPAIVKLLHRIGTDVAEDKVHTPHDRSGKPERLPLSERLYGKDGMGPKE